MSLGYKWQFEISPVPITVVVQEIIDKIPHVIEDYCFWPVGGDQEETELHLWGDGSLTTSIELEERHNELKELFPDKTVRTRWRCIEYDVWDEEFEG